MTKSIKAEEVIDKTEDQRTLYRAGEWPGHRGPSRVGCAAWQGHCRALWGQMYVCAEGGHPV